MEIPEGRKSLAALLAKWERIRRSPLKPLQEALRQAGRNHARSSQKKVSNTIYVHKGYKAEITLKFIYTVYLILSGMTYLIRRGIMYLTLSGMKYLIQRGVIIVGHMSAKSAKFFI